MVGANAAKGELNLIRRTTLNMIAQPKASSNDRRANGFVILTPFTAAVAARYFFVARSASFNNSSGIHLPTPFSVCPRMPTERSCQSLSVAPMGPRSRS
jgi:hypothetical protein